jgi:polyhydroxyalkanoate synthase
MASPFGMPDEFVQGFFKSGQTLLQGFASRPDITASPLVKAQVHYWEQQMALWMGMLASAASGKGPEPVVAAERGDRRFHAEDWRDNPWYSLLKQTYLLNARLLGDMVESADLDEKEKHKLRFFTRQFIDSMSPANFPATNPEALKLALETKGDSIRAGFANLLEDLRRERIAITDENAFEVGRNVAVSKGAVVFENELFQLIQYAPLTEQVSTRPLLIVPPCINKFYILDLQPENSFVRFACEQELTVFLVSWRNPQAELGQTTWDDYIESGAIKAIELALSISGADKVNVLGWCVGGTILSSALAVLISIPGAVGYVYAGWPAAVRYPDVAALQLPFAVGYVSLIGALLVIPTSLVTAPLGVRAAHAMSKRTLGMAFGTYLFIVGGRFVIGLVSGQ